MIVCMTDEKLRRDALFAREDALGGDDGFAVLELIKAEMQGLDADALKKGKAPEPRLSWYFTEYLDGEEVDPALEGAAPDAVSQGLAGRILGRLRDNPFVTKAPTERTVNRWLSGKTLISREQAYHICIAFDFGLDKSSDLFVNYLKDEFTRFNSLSEVAYRYAIQQGYDLHEAYGLWQRCLEASDVSGVDAAGAANVTILTSVIKSAYNDEAFENAGTDDVFLEFIASQKENFHLVRATRRRDLLNRLKGTGLSFESIADSLAHAFFVSDDDLDLDSEFDLDSGLANLDGGAEEDGGDSDGEGSKANRDPEPGRLLKTTQNRYFLDALEAIEGRRKNFTYEFYVLCLLVCGENDVDEINAALTSTLIGYPELYVNKLFDACVYEACKYAERTNTVAYDRFCDNMEALEFSRPEIFAYDNS